MPKTTIWKYKVSRGIELSMPVGAKVLTAREQGADICIWALVDTSVVVEEKRRFVTFGTGDDIPPAPLQYIGTAHLAGGATVVHVFEVLDTLLPR